MKLSRTRRRDSWEWLRILRNVWSLFGRNRRSKNPKSSASRRTLSNQWNNPPITPVNSNKTTCNSTPPSLPTKCYNLTIDRPAKTNQTKNSTSFRCIIKTHKNPVWWENSRGKALADRFLMTISKTKIWLSKCPPSLRISEEWTFFMPTSTLIID